jgi:hypothetical protein
MGFIGMFIQNSNLGMFKGRLNLWDPLLMLKIGGGYFSLILEFGLRKMITQTEAGFLGVSISIAYPLDT